MKFCSVATFTLISVLLLTVYYDEWLEPQWNKKQQQEHVVVDENNDNDY